MTDLKHLRDTLRRFLRRENGTASIEFVILVPAYIMVLVGAYESGLMMARYAMLDRGVDLAVRNLRVGTANPPSFDEFKASICDNAMMIADCENVLQVQLVPVPTDTWTLPAGGAPCIDQSSAIDPIDQTEYSVGINNELMIVRVCALYRPIYPTTHFGLRMPDDGNGNYALIVTSAFVNEPAI